MVPVMVPSGSRPRSLRLVFLLLVVAGVLIPGSPASACSCAEVDLAVRLPEVDGAFVGTFVDRSQISDQLASVTFDVERVVKGAFGPRAIVRTNAYGASCGLEFLGGPRIGLLLDRAADGVWESSLCQQVQPAALLSAAGGDHPPDPNVAAVSAGMHIRSIVLISAVVAVVVALIVVVLIARRGRSRPEESGVT